MTHREPPETARVCDMLSMSKYLFFFLFGYLVSYTFVNSTRLKYCFKHLVKKESFPHVGWGRSD